MTSSGEQIRRREFLASVGAPTLLGVTGCLSYFDSSLKLAGVSVANLTEVPRTVHVRVRDGSEEVHSSVHEVLPSEETRPGNYVIDEQVYVDCTWPSDRGHYVVEARLDQTDWESYDLAEKRDGDCYLATVMVREEEDLPGERRMYMFGQPICDREMPE